MDQFPESVSFQIFDIAVNIGIETAIRILQRASGVADDGNIGPVTISAIKSKSVTDLLMLIVAERLDFWRKLSTWPTFGKGWAGRAAQDLRYAAEDS
jgi:lysozyme family protein